MWLKLVQTKSKGLFYFQGDLAAWCLRFLTKQGSASSSRSFRRNRAILLTWSIYYVHAVLWVACWNWHHTLSTPFCTAVQTKPKELWKLFSPDLDTHFIEFCVVKARCSKFGLMVLSICPAGRLGRTQREVSLAFDVLMPCHSVFCCCCFWLVN